MNDKSPEGKTMLQGKYIHPAPLFRATNTTGWGDEPEPAWQAGLQQALRRAAGVAIAVVAPDGRLLYLQHDEPPPANAADEAQRRQLRQSLEAPDWIEELIASDAFARATREGVVSRQTVTVGGSESMQEQTIVPLASAGMSGPVLVAMRETSDWRRLAGDVERLSRFYEVYEIYEVTLNTMAEGILGIDAKGVIDFANPAAAGLLGWSIEDMIGCTSKQVLGTDSHLHQPRGVAGEARFRRQSGDLFVAEFRLSAKREDDTTQGAVLVFANITARKAAERELLELQKSKAHLRDAMQALESTQQQLFLSEKMSALSRFAAGVAYEISTPLTFVGCNLRSLESHAGKLLCAAGQDDSDTGNKRLPDLDVLRRDIPALFAETTKGLDRISDMLQNLRTFSQVDPASEWGPANLNTSLASTLELIMQEVGDGILIHNEIGELPLVECQTTQMNLVFHNLLANAIRAVGGKGEIWLRGGSFNNEVWIEVADNGCSMASGHPQQLLESFFITGTISQSMGLGISVAYGIIKRHGGMLSMSSRPGGGAVFRVVLPIAAAIGHATLNSGDILQGCSSKRPSERTIDSRKQRL